MNAQKMYKQTVITILDKITDDKTNQKNIEHAASMIADATIRDELIYVIGSGGHSNMMAEECMCRSGVLANLNPMLDATNLYNGTVKSRILQRNPAYAAGVLDQYYIPVGSILIIINAYGINALTIELAEEAKRRGIRTIGISSSDHFNNTPLNHPGRHPSNKTLFDVVDIALDSYMPHGDAVVEIENVEQRIGPVSTITSTFILQSLLMRSVELIAERHGTPDIWRSINLPGGDDYNVRLFKKYGNRVKYLL